VSRSGCGFGSPLPPSIFGRLDTPQTVKKLVPGLKIAVLPMRTTSFILAIAFILAGPSVAGSSDKGMPSVGTFAYNGSPLASPAAQPILVAAK